MVTGMGLRVVVAGVDEGATIPMASAKPLRGVFEGRVEPFAGVNNEEEEVLLLPPSGASRTWLLTLLLLLLLLLVQMALGDMRVKNSPSRSIHEV
jgi:hypothetical protein